MASYLRIIVYEARGRVVPPPINEPREWFQFSDKDSGQTTEERGCAVLRDDINKALTEAMKAKNERAVSTLRMVNSSLKNADIEARGAGKPPLGDAEVLSLLQKMIKQRQESIELYQKGGRADLVKQEQEEIAIISGYLPSRCPVMKIRLGLGARGRKT